MNYQFILGVVLGLCLARPKEIWHLLQAVGKEFRQSRQQK